MKKSDNQNKIVIYKTAQNEVELSVRFENESVWLMQSDIALLFGTQRSAITKHLNNIFKSGELKQNSVSSILEHTATDGKIRKINFPMGTSGLAHFCLFIFWIRRIRFITSRVSAKLMITP